MQPALFLSFCLLPKTQAQAVGLEITSMSHVLKGTLLPDFVFPFFGPNCSIGSPFFISECMMISFVILQRYFKKLVNIMLWE